MIPSGKRLHNYDTMEHPPIFHGKTHVIIMSLPLLAHLFLAIESFRRVPATSTAAGTTGPAMLWAGALVFKKCDALADNF